MRRGPTGSGGGARALFWLTTAGVTWVYAGYPLALAALGRVAPRARRRAPLTPRVSVIVAAHDEAGIIGPKVADVHAARYPPERVQVVVASDGSTDATVAEARSAGADVVLDLPRIGKIAALNAAVARASGDVLVFTDADARFEPETLTSLVANFADPEVGGVAANEITQVRRADGSVARGEGLYWRYEQWIKRLEDRVGSAVSASGRLYAVRRELFVPSTIADGTDDFLISTQVVRAGRRLAFDAGTRVLVETPQHAGPELRRKVRVMNRGLRAAFSLGPLLLPTHSGLYAVQVLSHKVLRRFVPFLLAGALAAGVRLVAVRGARWWAGLAPQVGLYGLAAAGWAGRERPWGRHPVVAVPYYFCLANAAAGLAVVSLLRGERFERWEPDRTAQRRPANLRARASTGQAGVPRA